MNKDEYAKIEITLTSLIKEIAGEGCDLHSAKPVKTFYDERYQVNRLYSPETDKGFIGNFLDDSMDFCGYNYSMENNQIIVRLRHKTIAKIAERIKEYTEGGNLRWYDLPEELFTEERIGTIILKLNRLSVLITGIKNGSFRDCMA